MSISEAKKTISALSLEYVKIHAYSNDTYYVEKSMMGSLNVLGVVYLDEKTITIVLTNIRKGFLQRF